jgi:hypothetical protein
MRRIESTHVPGETRRMLRERLPRFLPENPVSTGHLARAVRPLVSDMEILDLYLNLEFIPGDDLSQARLLYEQASQAQIATPTAPSIPQPSRAGTSCETTSVLSTEKSASTPPLEYPEGNGSSTGENNSTEDTDNLPTAPIVSVQITAASPSLEGLSPPPSFDELVERGWIRTSWGRFDVPHDIVMAILRNQQTVGTAFRQLVEERTRDVLKLKSGFNPNGMLRDIANEVVTGQHLPSEIVCVSRDWIAARLWDTNSDGANDGGGEQRIGKWVDKWRLLNFPQFAMSNQLERASFEEFVEAAIGVLMTPSTTPGWEEFRNAATAPTALLYQYRGSAQEDIVPAIPATVVDRIRWMTQGAYEQTFHEYLGTRGSSLLSVLLNELKYATFNPLGLAARLMEVVVQRPVLLQQLALMARQTPVLLADMLMVPSTCTMACCLIASWEFNGGGWNRDFQAHANNTTELLAFEDALALLGGHLDAGHMRSSELAALYLYVYELASAPRQPDHRYTMLSLLREEVAAADVGIQDAVVAALIASAAADSDPMTAICAALDLATEGGCADRIAPSGIVSLYLDVVMPRGERLGFRMLESKSAQSLVALALRCDETLRTRFLQAIDVPAWLRLAPTSENEQYAFLERLKYRIRLHIRVMSRAIAGWPTEIPDELVSALAHDIHAGATDQPNRNRVDAFALGLGVESPWATEERPIALDLAAALRRVQGNAMLVTQLCQVEEPVVLAGIVANTPAAINGQIKAHLLTLTPATSSEVWSLPALQARVDALLNAGLPDIAEVFITAERDAMTLGAVPSREVSTLRADLQLQLLREDWPAIASYTLPEGIKEPLRQEANDVLLFYQGIAELKKHEGNPEAAEAIFFGLTNRHRGVTAYHINLFACRVHRLLGSDGFRLLSGEALRQARLYLAEAQRETRPLIQHSAPDLKALDSNRAILLLAANQPRESLQVLLELRETTFDAHTEGFRALALARLGSKREALAVLTQADRVFGRSDFLSAIRENIDTHRPYATAPSLSLDDDPVPGIRQAFEAFARLGHVEQAEILQSRGRLDLYLLEEVRGACASLVALAPMMSELGMVRLEDDISGVLKQILRSRLLLPQWAVEDQPRGGFSKPGGVGERDILISKGTTTLAVIEALIVDYVETGNLTSHLNKLLGYDTCRFFFHITYARRANCAGILAHLKTACTTPPSGINYIRSEDLEDFDSMPVGFKAHYEIDSRCIVVVFLALEIGQPIQRAAAAAQ